MDGAEKWVVISVILSTAMHTICVQLLVKRGETAGDKLSAPAARLLSVWMVWTFVQNFSRFWHTICAQFFHTLDI